MSVEYWLYLHSPKYIIGTTTSRSLTAVILILSICMPYKAGYGTPVDICNKSCSCNPVDMGQDPAINVQCGERNLTNVPNMTFTKPVSILNVSFNELKTLEKETFFHYKSVSHLHLQRCSLRSINEESFHCLVNLIFVDLSDNLLTSVSPNLFIGNQHLNELILQGNKLVDLQGHLNGPPHLSKLNLQSCKLKQISSETFSSLPNLQYLDISNNELERLNYDTLSSHQQLVDVNLENNQWKCGEVFHDLLCWIKSKEAVPHNRTLKCWNINGTKELWTPAKQSSLCRLNTTSSANSSHKTDTNTSWALNTTAIWSKTSDVSPKMTLNSTTQFKEETVTNGVSALTIALIVIVIVIVIAIGTVILILWRKEPITKRYVKLAPSSI